MGVVTAETFHLSNESYARSQFVKSVVSCDRGASYEYL